MPTDSLSRRFPPHPDLAHLIDMPVTYSAIDCYVVAPRRIDAPFRISNVFAIPYGLPAWLRDDLNGYRQLDGGDTALLLSQYVQREHLENPYVLGGRSLPDRVIDRWSSITGETPRDAWNAWSKEHDRDVRGTCHVFYRHWSNEIYESYRVGFFSGRQRYPLVSQRREPPNFELADQLSASCELRHLIVLTAQQELASMYDWVLGWYERAQRGERFSMDLGLDDSCLAALSSRTRGYRYWKTGLTTAGRDGTQIRGDLPQDAFIPRCSLAWAYWLFYRWYRLVHTIVVEPAQCENDLPNGERCKRAARLRVGPGRRPTLCGPCQKDPERRRRQGKERARRSRERHTLTRNAK